MAEACSLRVLSSLSAPIEGATLRVFSGVTTVTWGVTDALGVWDLVLPAGAYTVRGYKVGTSFGAPFSFTVVVGAVNEFDLVADEAQSTPVPRDARICILRGYVLNGFGAPLPNVSMIFHLDQPPTVMGNDLVLGNSVAARTDSAGYVEIPLIRTATYRFVLPGVFEQGDMVAVPDSATAELAHVLFPEVGSVSWAEDSLTVAVDQLITVSPVVRTTAGVVLEGAARDYLIWSAADPAILGVASVEGGLVLLGRAVGTTEIQATRVLPSEGYALVPRIPAVVIAGLPKSVEVTL